MWSPRERDRSCQYKSGLAACPTCNEADDTSKGVVEAAGGLAAIAPEWCSGAAEACTGFIARTLALPSEPSPPLIAAPPPELAVAVLENVVEGPFGLTTVTVTG